MWLDIPRIQAQEMLIAINTNTSMFADPAERKKFILLLVKEAFPGDAELQLTMIRGLNEAEARAKGREAQFDAQLKKRR